MACTDCFNNCSEITSDKCIKYTGVAIPLLGIQTGDSLSFVEQAIIGFLTSTLDGSGVLPIITEGVACELFTSYLPDCKDVSLNDLLVALIKTACQIDTRVTDVQSEVDAIESAYYIPEGCLDVNSNAGTHAILQTVIGLLCTIQLDLTTLALDLHNNYASIGTELNAQISNYLNTIAPITNKMYLKMLPYTVVEYYGPLSNYPTSADYFDATGAGHGVWEQVYLCNGDNNTPDKRGRVGVGVTNMFGSIPLDTVVDPAILGNPTYTVKSKTGVNTIVLSSTQIPAHSHTATSTPTVTPHSHFTVGSAIGSDVTLTSSNTLRTESKGSDTNSYILRGVALPATTGMTNAITVPMTVATTVTNTGGGLSHNNIQPGIGCYYLIYIPL